MYDNKMILLIIVMEATHSDYATTHDVSLRNRYYKVSSKKPPRHFIESFPIGIYFSGSELGNILSLQCFNLM